MYNIDEIRHLHLEISSICNAACPLCPRNFYGYPYNDGYVEHNMTLDEAKKIFSETFLKQLVKIDVNGNFGDIVMNKHGLSIIKYFKKTNPNLKITVDSNGGGATKTFWQELAKTGCEVRFSIDGLADTNHLYRQNVSWDTLMKNVNIFIASCGQAIWKVVKFDHNKHQIDEIKQLAKQMGFASVQVDDHGRDTGPVFDKKGELVHVMGQAESTDFKFLFNRRKTVKLLLEDVIDDRKPTEISCYVKKQKSVYVSSTGEVYPCCKLGFSPKTYGHGAYHAVANAQFKDFIHENNALEYDLEHCINWFNKIEKTWDIPTFEEGRLLICHDVCGQ